jgi:S-adenosylmethionine hydrolase
MWLLLSEGAKNDKLAEVVDEKKIMRYTTVGASSAQVDTTLVKGVISYTDTFGHHGVQLLLGTLRTAESDFSATARCRCQELVAKYKLVTKTSED